MIWAQIDQVDTFVWLNWLSYMTLHHMSSNKSHFGAIPWCLSYKEAPTGHFSFQACHLRWFWPYFGAFSCCFSCIQAPSGGLLFKTGLLRWFWHHPSTNWSHRVCFVLGGPTGGFRYQAGHQRPFWHYPSANKSRLAYYGATLCCLRYYGATLWCLRYI
jgi:hypothetical protein